jgi:hypothetical protein
MTGAGRYLTISSGLANVLDPAGGKQYAIDVDDGLLYDSWYCIMGEATYIFETADLQAPTFTAAADGDVLYDSTYVLLAFNEAVQAGSGVVTVASTLGGGTVTTPCASAGVDGTVVTLDPSFWTFEPCEEYTFSWPADCFPDASLNSNGATGTVQFRTACLSSVAPLQGAREVAVHTPVVFGFARGVVPTGSIEIVPRGHAASTVQSSSVALEYDPAGPVRLIMERLHANGVCGTLALADCKGKEIEVTVPDAAFSLATGTWSDGSTALSPQLGPSLARRRAATASVLARYATLGVAAGWPAPRANVVDADYSFDVTAHDFSPPSFLSMHVRPGLDMAVVQTFVTETGLVQCAPFPPATTFPATADILAQPGLVTTSSQWDMALRAAVARLTLTGLTPDTDYVVYCTAGDATLNPTTSVMHLSTRFEFTTLERVAPTISISIASVGMHDVTVSATTSEAASVYCAAFPAGGGAPDPADVLALGTVGETTSAGGFTTSVVYAGLRADWAYDAYCAAADVYVGGGGYGAVDVPTLPRRTVAAAADILATRRAFHTKKDTQKPLLVALHPAHDTFAPCDQNYPNPGCAAELMIEFHEDVVRGTGNVNIRCVTFGCGDNLYIPVDTPTWMYGTTTVRGRFFVITFTSYHILLDREWTLSYEAGVVKDTYDNECEAFSGTDAEYHFKTPISP